MRKAPLTKRRTFYDGGTMCSLHHNYTFSIHFLINLNSLYKKIEPHSIRKGLLLILNDYTNDITEEYTQS